MILWFYALFIFTKHSVSPMESLVSFAKVKIVIHRSFLQLNFSIVEIYFSVSIYFLFLNCFNRQSYFLCSYTVYGGRCIIFYKPLWVKNKNETVSKCF